MRAKGISGLAVVAVCQLGHQVCGHAHYAVGSLEKCAVDGVKFAGGNPTPHGTLHVMDAEGNTPSTFCPGATYFFNAEGLLMEGELNVIDDWGETPELRVLKVGEVELFTQFSRGVIEGGGCHKDGEPYPLGDRILASTGHWIAPPPDCHGIEAFVLARAVDEVPDVGQPVGGIFRQTPPVRLTQASPAECCIIACESGGSGNCEDTCKGLNTAACSPTTWPSANGATISAEVTSITTLSIAINAAVAAHSFY